jgi:c-di-GMP-binding flagellar brake protein YcgR
MDSAPNRRGFSRFRMAPPLPVQLRIVGRPPMPDLLLVDLSPTGCAVVLAAGLAPTKGGDAGRWGIVELTMTLPGDASPCRAAATIRNIVPLRAGGVRVGLEFVPSVSAQDRLRERIDAFLLEKERAFLSRTVGWKTK